MNGYNLPDGCTSAEVDAQCGPDEPEVTEAVIKEAVSLATTDVMDEHLTKILGDESLYIVLRAAIMPLAEFAIRAKTDEYLETFKQTGEFK